MWRLFLTILFAESAVFVCFAVFVGTFWPSIFVLVEIQFKVKRLTINILITVYYLVMPVRWPANFWSHFSGRYPKLSSKFFILFACDPQLNSELLLLLGAVY